MLRVVEAAFWVVDFAVACLAGAGSVGVASASASAVALADLVVFFAAAAFVVLDLAVLDLAVPALAWVVFVVLVVLLALADLVAVSVPAAAVLLERREVFLVAAFSASAFRAVSIEMDSAVSPSGKEALSLPCLIYTP